MGALSSTPTSDKFINNMRTSHLCSRSDDVQNYHTGDVVLFSGNTLSALIIEWLTWCRYSHVGMIIDGRDLVRIGVEASDEPYLFESVHTPDELPCCLGRNGVAGVRVVRLADKISDYQRKSRYATAHACVIQLETISHCSPAMRQALVANLLRFAHKASGHSYNVSVSSIIEESAHSDIFPALKAHTALSVDDPSRAYQCADLVASAMKAMNILKPTTQPTSFVPKSFMYIPDCSYVVSRESSKPEVYLSAVHYHCVISPDIVTPVSPTPGDIV